MKICILGDTHFGMRGDSLTFHNYCDSFYTNVFFPYLKENNIKEIYQLGDLFDRRKFINFNTLYLCRKYFFDKIKNEGMTLHTLLGNHDIYFRNTLEVNSSQMLLKEYNNIIVYDEPKNVIIDGTHIDIIPWICDENQEKIGNFIKNSKSEIVFGHFEIVGFEMDRGNISHDGIDKKILRRYEVVLSGHFHHKSTDGQITYVGTPGEMNWADYDDQRGFHVFDTETRSLTFVPNPYRIFCKINYDDTVNDFQFWKSYDYSQHKDTYIKVVVVNKTNAYLFDLMLDNLLKAGVADISVVEDFTEADSDDEIIDEAEDTVTILNKYIDGLTIDVEHNKLKSLMKEIYVEALNTNVTD